MNVHRPVAAGPASPTPKDAAAELYRPPVTRNEDHIDRLYRLIGWMVCLAYMGGGILYAVFAVH